MAQPDTDTTAPSEATDDGIPIDENPGVLYDGAAVSRIIQKRLASEKKRHAKQLREAVLETARICRGNTP